ncbi:MAG: PhzF family phenazine biosynthesis protein [Halovenus sp.]
MERLEVLVVDAFADEPTGGRQVAVLPNGDGCSEIQRRAVADELGAAGTVTGTPDGLAYVGADAPGTVIEGAVAGVGALVDAAGESLTVTADDRELEIEVTDEGMPWVETARMDVGSASVEEARVASALGIDVAAVRDVAADLPVGKAAGGGGSLLVPVNFLEHLGRVDPDAGALSTLLEDVGARRAVAFSFDTLRADTDIHTRVLDPAVRGDEQPTGALGVAACGPHLVGNGVFDGERTEIRIECGHFLDRPATITATLDSQPQVTGPAVTAVDGTISVPADSDDEILEV